MRFQIFALTLLSLAVSPVGAGERVAVRVSPRTAFAPADLTVLATIEANPENRVLEIIAESDEFYRSSEIPLEGELAAKATFVRFQALPSGSYVVKVIVRGAHGQRLGVTQAFVNVVGRE
jgi:hypothetical protein